MNPNTLSVALVNVSCSYLRVVTMALCSTSKHAWKIWLTIGILELKITASLDKSHDRSQQFSKVLVGENFGTQFRIGTRLGTCGNC